MRVYSYTEYHHSPRENRYLLFLTENYAALQTLQHFLAVNYQNTEEGDGPSTYETAVDQPPLILFGSSFPKDRHFTQVRKSSNNINNILNAILLFDIRCVEILIPSKSVWRLEELLSYLTWMTSMKASMMH